jgi:CRISPR-associated protein Csm2
MDKTAFRIPGKAEMGAIITDPDGTETLVRWADDIGQGLKNHGLATNQIRSLYGEVLQIQALWGMGQDQRRQALRRLILLKPKMAYRARRERGKAVQNLVSVLEPALDLVISEGDPDRQNQNFRNFVDFFEAILAYHKAYGGS